MITKRMMTNRERLFAVLNGEPPDRVPIWLLFPYHQIGCYTDVRENPRYSEIYELSRERAVMLDRRVMPVPIFAPDVSTRSEEFADGAWQVKREHIEWEDVRLFSETRRNGTEVRIKKAIENEDDLAAFARLPVNCDPERIEKQLDERLPAYLAEKDEFPAEYGSMMLALGEPIASLYNKSDLTEYPIWSLTQNETVIGILEAHMQRFRLVYKYCLERDLSDVYFLIGSELASPPMLSRATFQQWVVPFAKELIEMVHSYGKKAIQHYHGQISEVLPDFLDMHPDALHTIEAPPVGDTTLTQAFDVVGDEIALIGNIQYDCFRSYTKDQMRKAVRAVLDETRGKRFILSPSAGPFDDDIDDRVRENYLEFMRAGWECDSCVS